MIKARCPGASGACEGFCGDQGGMPGVGGSYEGCAARRGHRRLGEGVCGDQGEAPEPEGHAKGCAVIKAVCQATAGSARVVR